MNLALVLCLPLGGLLGDQIGFCIIANNTNNTNSNTNTNATCVPWSPAELVSAQNKGFRRAMQSALLLFIALVVPAFGVINIASVSGVVLGQGIFVITLGVFGANLPAFMASLFEKRLRYSGLGIGEDCDACVMMVTLADA